MFGRTSRRGDLRVMKWRPVFGMFAFLVLLGIPTPCASDGRHYYDDDDGGNENNQRILTQLRSTLRQKILGSEEELGDILPDNDVSVLSLAIRENLLKQQRLEESSDDGSEEDDSDELGGFEDDDYNNQTMPELDPDLLISLKAGFKMSFDCWDKPQSVCESKYCTWANNMCTISPAAYYHLCNFYCETSICLQPLTPGSVPCQVRQRSLGNLCSTLKRRANCRNQHGLCQWNRTKRRCVNSTTTCCPRVQVYCVQRKREQLWPALRACAGFTVQSEICTFWQEECRLNV